MTIIRREGSGAPGIEPLVPRQGIKRGPGLKPKTNCKPVLVKVPMELIDSMENFINQQNADIRKENQLIDQRNRNKPRNEKREEKKRERTLSGVIVEALRSYVGNMTRQMILARQY